MLQQRLDQSVTRPLIPLRTRRPRRPFQSPHIHRQHTAPPAPCRPRNSGSAPCSSRIFRQLIVLVHERHQSAVLAISRSSNSHPPRPPATSGPMPNRSAAPQTTARSSRQQATAPKDHPTGAAEAAVRLRVHVRPVPDQRLLHGRGVLFAKTAPHQRRLSPRVGPCSPRLPRSNKSIGWRRPSPSEPPA